MKTKDEVMNLSNIGGGAAMEIFDLELAKVLRNIMDPNTDPKAIREIVIKVRFRPDDDRDLGAVEVVGGSKLEGNKGFMTKVCFGRDSSGRFEAREFETGQQTLFTKGNVVPIHKEGGE